MEAIIQAKSLLDIGNAAARHGNIGARWHVEPHHLFAGRKAVGHKHATDHLTYLEEGTIELLWRDEDGNKSRDEYTAPMWIDVPAERFHTIIAKTEAKWHCIFAAPSDKLLHEPFWAQIPPDYKGP
jgi:hypothetical protein